MQLLSGAWQSINNNIIALTSAQDTIMHLDKQFVYQLLFQLVNTAVIVAALGYVLYAPVLKFLRARQSRVAEQIDEANSEKQEALKLKEEYERKLSEIDKERENILSEAARVAYDKEVRILDYAKLEAKGITQRADAEVYLEKAKARDEMKVQIIEISSLLAEKYITKKLDDEEQKNLLDEVISNLAEEMGDLEWLS